MLQQVTTNENEWYNDWQRMTSTGNEKLKQESLSGRSTTLEWKR